MDPGGRVDARDNLPLVMVEVYFHHVPALPLKLPIRPLHLEGQRILPTYTLTHLVAVDPDNWLGPIPLPGAATAGAGAPGRACLEWAKLLEVVPGHAAVAGGGLDAVVACGEGGRVESVCVSLVDPRGQLPRLEPEAEHGKHGVDGGVGGEGGVVVHGGEARRRRRRRRIGIRWVGSGAGAGAEAEVGGDPDRGRGA